MKSVKNQSVSPRTCVFVTAIVFGIFLSCCESNSQKEPGLEGHHIQKHRQGQNSNGHSGHSHGKNGKFDSLVMKGTGGTGAGNSLHDFHDSENNSHSPDDDEYDDYQEENQNGLEDEWGTDFSNKDLKEIGGIVRQEEDEEIENTDGAWISTRGPRRIGKCCAFDQSLNSQGQCVKSHPHPRDNRPNHHDESWFPDKVYDFEKLNWTIPNQADWNITTELNIKCPPNERPEVIFDVNKFVVLSNGRLYLTHHEKDLAPLAFCLDLLVGQGRAVRSCFSQAELCGEKSNCLRKCCPEKAMVQEPSGSCVLSPNKVQNNFPKDKWNIIHGAPACAIGQYLTEVTQFSIGDAGNLNAITEGNNSINASFLDYCLDFFTETEALKNLIENSDDDKGNLSRPSLKAQICFESFDQRDVNGRSKHGLIHVPKGIGIVYGSALILSAICIALAAFVSWRLAELRSLHGKCQLSHLATLFLLFIMLAIVHLASDVLLPSKFCTFLAVAIHMCALSAFLWLNLLCVNIYLTFRYLRPPLAARREENRRLFFLCVYAWGIPAAFCLFLFLLDSQPGRLEPMPHPGYGERSCLISNRGAQFAYLFGPVGLLLLLNGVLFCLTAKELLCGLWRMDNSDSINFRRKSMGIVVGKMGIVMGMGWILDVLSWVVGTEFPYLFYAADLFNALQGVFIFLVLIWRKRVLEILHLRKPSVVKDETITAHRPFLPKSSFNNSTVSHNGDADTSLVLVQD